MLERLEAELRRGAHDAAERTAEAAVTQAEAMFGPGEPELITPLYALASARLARGELGGAKEACTRAIAIARARGPREPPLADLTDQLALVEIAEQLAAGNADGAAYERALAIVSARAGERALEARLAHNYAAIREQAGDHAEAESLYRRALSLAEAEHGAAHAALRPTLVRLARLLHARGDFDAAAPLYERALAIAEREAAGHEVVTALRVWLGDARTRTVR